MAYSKLENIITDGAWRFTFVVEDTQSNGDVIAQTELELNNPQLDDEHACTVQLAPEAMAPAASFGWPISLVSSLSARRPVAPACVGCSWSAGQLQPAASPAIAVQASYFCQQCMN
jgi:hypothetical protein